MVDIISMEKNTRSAIQNMTTIEKESKLQHDTRESTNKWHCFDLGLAGVKGSVISQGKKTNKEENR